MARHLCGLLLALLVASVAHARSAPPAAYELTVGASRLALLIPPREFASDAVLREWVQRSAGIVARYYRRFPVSAVRIIVIPVDGDGIQGGSTFGQPAPLIRIRVGRAVTAAALRNDWVLVHEMVHLALPDVGEAHAWLAEGLAVYVEGVARVQAGNRSIEDVFAEEQRSMPRGMPSGPAAGLDQDHSWGRTYWGGAMFCLLADVQIHERTHNRRGLQDALQAVLRATGGIIEDRDINQVFATADAAVGVPVLSELYARMKDSDYAPDLPGLWRSLGVESDGGGIRIVDQAPLAAIRQAIFRPTPP
ncbi:MAG TPA: hypothetical protein VMF03_04085 [Steroidobacteraceae bacterium]|nr:hypothetical protein [Steroidobacteraceae bacterium]